MPLGSHDRLDSGSDASSSTKLGAGNDKIRTVRANENMLE